MIEKTVSSKKIYSGRVVSLTVHTVEGPNGRTTREVVDHVPAVTIIPFQPPDTIYLIRQFRKATENVLIEAPAGCMNPNESPEQAAMRELAEETGLTAQSWRRVGDMYMAPGFCNEYMHVFLAQGVSQGSTQFDSDEYMECQQYRVSEVANMIDNRAIIDAKTIVGFLLCRPYLDPE